ncbi:MAG: helix-turn-helix transcriptional regulator [Symploca sp. SIO2B6]|nr:helix-turn-helix transcriptional regulator [Symploca sp. SIO2B6]
MKPLATQQIECACLPVSSSQSQGWEHILVEEFQHPSGEGKTLYSHEHVICLSLTPRPVRFLQIKDGKTHTGPYGKGDISLTPVQMPFFARWQGDDHYLQIRIASDFIDSVASEALAMNPDRLELRPEFRTRDHQIESIGLMLLSELKQQNVGSKLYIESLTNILAVHLLRKYSASQPNLARHEGGLSEPQLRQVLEYIHEYLDQEIKLANLAQLLGISQFHFSHLFKKSMGIPPHQYLLQQRVERSKQLLKQTDQSIVEIALECGFNSHSHFSKQFRQLIGITPSTYRAS